MASRRVEKLESDTNVRISGGALGAEHVALGEEGGDVEGSRPECAAERAAVHPREPRRTWNSGRREIEGKRSEVGLDNLRQRAGNQLLMFVPEAMARPRSRAAGAAATLIGGRPRTAHRLETSHAGARRKAPPPDQPGIGDDAHPRNREARLVDRRLQ